jgi:hypothetical protein
MKERLDKLEEKTDSVMNDLTEVKVALTEIKGDLKEHMRRTFANEEANNLLREYIDVLKKEQDIKNEGYDQIVDRIKFIGVLIGGLGGIITFLVSLGILHF